MPFVDQSTKEYTIQPTIFVLPYPYLSLKIINSENPDNRILKKRDPEGI